MGSSKTSSKASVRRLLLALRSKRERDEFADSFPQEIEAAQPIGEGIPTLKAGVYRRPTPMLAARFAFCGRWTNASIGLVWLGARDMAKALRDKELMELVRVRKEYWEGSVPSTHPRERLSLFAVDREDHSEVYLVWREEDAEPRLVWYQAQHESEFNDLKHYLEFLNGMCRA